MYVLIGHKVIKYKFDRVMLMQEMYLFYIHSATTCVCGYIVEECSRKKYDVDECHIYPYRRLAMHKPPHMIY